MNSLHEAVMEVLTESKRGHSGLNRLREALGHFEDWVNAEKTVDTKKMALAAQKYHKAMALHHASLGSFDPTVSQHLSYSEDAKANASEGDVAVTTTGWTTKDKRK